jgi:hypothetical protein
MGLMLLVAILDVHIFHSLGLNVKLFNKFYLLQQGSQYGLVLMSFEANVKIFQVFVYWSF